MEDIQNKLGRVAEKLARGWSRSDFTATSPIFSAAMSAELAHELREALASEAIIPIDTDHTYTREVSSIYAEPWRVQSDYSRRGEGFRMAFRSAALQFATHHGDTVMARRGDDAALDALGAHLFDTLFRRDLSVGFLAGAFDRENQKPFANGGFHSTRPITVTPPEDPPELTVDSVVKMAVNSSAFVQSIQGGIDQGDFERLFAPSPPIASPEELPPRDDDDEDEPRIGFDALARMAYAASCMEAAAKAFSVSAQAIVGHATEMNTVMKSLEGVMNELEKGCGDE